MGKRYEIYFLDVDGVLNNVRAMASSPEGWRGEAQVFLKKLSKIVEATNAKIILTSTWKQIYYY